MLISFVLILSHSLSSFGQYNFMDYSLKIDDSYQINYGALFDTDALTYQKIVNDKNEFQNYDDFLRYLSKKRPTLFDKPVLVHSSGSIQFADKNHPRVLLSDGNIFFGFSENPNNKARDVEIIEFDKKKKAFVAHEISFTEKNETLFTESPLKCFACHGNPIRPLWKPYDIWPTAFGSQSDTFSSDQESTAYFNFLNQPEKTGIYTYIKYETDLLSSQNLVEFTMMLTSLNQIRANEILKKNKNAIFSLRYYLIAAFNGCFDKDPIKNKPLYSPEEFMSPDALKELPPFVFYQNDTIEARSAMMKYLNLQYFSIFNSDLKNISISERLDFENNLIAPARWVLEPLGIYWREMSLADGTNDYSVQTPSNLIVEWSTGMAEIFNEVFVEMTPTLVAIGGVDPEIKRFPMFDCSQLKLKSIAATKNMTFPLANYSVETSSRDNTFIGLSSMSRCIKCHSEGSQLTITQAPLIPFDDNMKLAKWLNTANNFQKTISHISKGSMPKNSILSSDEKDSISAVLRHIRDMSQ